MSTLKIRCYGDPVLEKPATLVKNITDKEIALINDMFETMHTVDGVGLAANQVGVSKQILVIDASRGQLKKEQIVIINAEIVYCSPEVIRATEGCLSLPNIEGNVERAASIVVRGLNLEGKSIEFEAKEILARIFQHEIDHINGKLFIERMGHIDKQLLFTKLRKLKKETILQLKEKK